MTKVTREDIEGAIDVNGDVTPITRQPIEQVDAADWSDRSVAELARQRVTLQNRLAYCQQHGSMDMIKALKMGITQIDLVIKSKHNNDVGLI